MKRIRGFSALILALFCFATALLAQTPALSLQGVVTDPSGALVPGALVQLRGPGPEQRATTDATGHYNLSSLRPGKYTVRVIAKGFTISTRELELASPITLDVQLAIEAESQVVNVEDAAGSKRRSILQRWRNRSPGQGACGTLRRLG